MKLAVPKNEVTCPRCGRYDALSIFLAPLGGEYLLCKCGVFKVIDEDGEC